MSVKYFSLVAADGRRYTAIEEIGCYLVWSHEEAEELSQHLVWDDAVAEVKALAELVSR
jgi:hypothetical protein